jgi:hypothetical protein
VNVIRTIQTSPYIGPSLGTREPEFIPQPCEQLTYEQRDLDHVMRCTKVGCLRCAS